MKKLFLIAIAAVFAVSASAQNYESNIISIRGGLNFADWNLKNDGSTVGTDSRVGFHIGATDQILLFHSLPLYLEPGLFLTARGAKDNGEAARPMYIQVPVVLNYHINIKDKVSIEPFAGVYYALGIGGKTKVEDGNGNKVKTDLFGDDGLLKRSDFGFRTGVGVVFAEHFYVGAGYEFGCLDLIKDNDSNAKLHADCVTVSVGYKF